MKASVLLSIFLSSSCIWHAAFATILRLPCMSNAVFDVIEVGKRLASSLIERYHSTTDVQCTVLCVQHEKCRSYNINRERMICELNSKALVDNGTELYPDESWAYKSTNYSNPWIGPTCTELKPCGDGILCRDTCAHPFYECIQCDQHHTGLHCDRITDANNCEKSPCRNSGICTDQQNGYKCTCSSGFTGKNCENEVDACYSLPCFNGASCQNVIGSFQCTCMPEYTGVHCEEKITKCISDPCANGGTCIAETNSYSCTCSTGYTGVNCEIELNECISNPCSFDKHCIDHVNGYSCAELPNIALFKPTLQSSFYHGIKVPTLQSSLAVDGKADPLYSAGTCTHTLNDNRPWWQVDLRDIYQVLGVEITNRADNVGFRLSNFIITVDGVFCLHRSNPIADGATEKLQCQNATIGQHLKVQLQKTEYLTICEIKIYGVGRNFFIQHIRGLCIAFDIKKKTFIMSKDCSEEFQFLPGNYLKHMTSGRCVAPDSNNVLVLQENCNDPKTRFAQTIGLSMKYLETGSCIHPAGGRIDSPHGTKVVVSPSCNEERIQFKFIEKQPFIIRNSCGLQLKFSSSKEIFELNDASTATLFIRLPDQSLKHLPSGNCVKPTAYANSANVAKAVNCSGDDTKFKQESNFAMKHVNTGKCIHPKGGSLTPSQGTNIVIYDGCNHIFQFVHVFQSFKIQHVDGLCLFLNASSKSLQFSTDCTHRFVMLPNLRIKHALTGQCLTQIDVSGRKLISVNDDCQSSFMQMSNKYVKNIETDKCMNSEGSGPVSQTSVTLGDDCSGTIHKFNFIYDSMSPCQNGGTFIESGGNRCECAGFAGALCENEIDECASNPCLNGGTCFNRINEYTCKCKEGCSGVNCVLDACSSGPCKNGGTCEAHDCNVYSCLCTIIWGGENCDSFLGIG